MQSQKLIAEICEWRCNNEIRTAEIINALIKIVGAKFCIINRNDTKILYITFDTIIDYLNWHKNMSDLFPSDGAIMIGKEYDSLVKIYYFTRIQGSILNFITYCAADKCDIINNVLRFNPDKHANKTNIKKLNNYLDNIVDNLLKK